jgi:hypothetical protein
MAEKSKCPGALLKFKTKMGDDYCGVPLCKGIWMAVTVLPKVFIARIVRDF